MIQIKNQAVRLCTVLLCVAFIFCGCSLSPQGGAKQTENTYYAETAEEILEEVPEFSNQAYVTLNDNQPEFTQQEKENESAFEEYSDLDSLGRCRTVYANICREIMPTKERGKIGQIKPSGWHLIKYDFVDGKYLYNRCHLIGYQLSGENANEKNLITGTRYLNVTGMLPFENEVADYVKETGHHVLYRVTPIYHADDLVATGVQMEAYSVEDDGEGVCFNVFAYNSEPGVEINYADGSSRLQTDSGDTGRQETKKQQTGASGKQYVLNTNTRKFHKPSCDSVFEMADHNREYVYQSREEIIADGYEPCRRCNP